MLNLHSIFFKISLLFSTFLFINFSSQALMVNQSSTAETEENAESIEIITITANRSLAFFRQQHRQAEDEFFAALNALALDDSYEIKCERKNNSFSRIKRRVCEPKYVDEIKFELTQLAVVGRAELQRRFQDGLYKLPSRGVIKNSVNAKRKKHLAALSKVIENNPELQQKLINLNKANYSLEQKKAEVFGKELTAASSDSAVETTKDKEHSN
ncbi:MAG: hypothetical protein Alis3KO_38120 [Aliiglaciecola sp.]